LFENLNDLKDYIVKKATELFEDETLFLVDVSIPSDNGGKITVVIDGDNGVSIENCIALSRKLGADLEEKDLIDQAFILDVTSPGVGTPLSMMRQYQKNIGREVRIKTPEMDVTGKLISATENEVTIIEKKTKKKEEIKHVIPFEKIKSTIVQVSFK